MVCEVRASGGLGSPAVVEHAMTRVAAAIGHFADRVARVRVRLEDVNGPRHGGADKRCTVDVALVRGGQIIVRELRDDLYAAITVAADRTKSVIGRRLARRRG